MFSVSKKVKIFTEVGVGDGNVKSAWASGVVSGIVSKPMPGFEGRPGVTVFVAESCYKNKHIFVEDASFGVQLEN